MKEASNGTDLFQYVYSSKDPATNQKSYKVYKNSTLLYSIQLTTAEWDLLREKQMFQDGEDTYVAFTISKDNDEDTKDVRVWKNGNLLSIQITDVIELMDIYVKNSKIYSAIYRYDPKYRFKPELYKDSQLMPLDYDGNFTARIFSIYVK